MNLHSSDYCGAGEDVMGSASRDIYEKTCQLLEKSCRWRESKDRVLQVMSDAAALVQCAYTRSAVTWTQLQLLHVRNRLSPFRICFGGDCVETPVDVIPEVSFPVPT